MIWIIIENRNKKQLKKQFPIGDTGVVYYDNEKSANLEAKRRNAVRKGRKHVVVPLFLCTDKPHMRTGKM